MPSHLVQFFHHLNEYLIDGAGAPFLLLRGPARPRRARGLMEIMSDARPSSSLARRPSSLLSPPRSRRSRLIVPLLWTAAAANNRRPTPKYGTLPWLAVSRVGGLSVSRIHSVAVNDRIILPNLIRLNRRFNHVRIPRWICQLSLLRSSNAEEGVAVAVLLSSAAFVCKAVLRSFA